ncbi:hypothetical protein GJ496_004845 [Pomphorhynchus laevis]|nr:hypothetical protein GJ496_004845 [Pomphorhynchus laevis]
MPRERPAASHRCCNCNGQAAVCKGCRCAKSKVPCLDCLAPNCRNHPTALVPVITGFTVKENTVADDHLLQVDEFFPMRIPISEGSPSDCITQNTERTTVISPVGNDGHLEPDLDEIYREVIL